MKQIIYDYIANEEKMPLFLTGYSLLILKQIPDNSIDCCMTSPPYWKKREYANGGIGLEDNYEDYINNLVNICMEVYRVIKPTGSFWLNIGDTYQNKNLLNIPWRVAIELTNKGWILRNIIIWNKLNGGMDNSKDRLGNAYEPLFHFVKKSKLSLWKRNIKKNVELRVKLWWMVIVILFL
ncbi:MAG: DNA-methyltransferase [Lachnospiraceae bacterium]